MGWKDMLAQYSNPYEETVHVTAVASDGKHPTITSNRIHPYSARLAAGAVLATASVASNSAMATEGHVYAGEIAGGAWVDAQCLQPGDELLSEDNQWQSVEAAVIEDEPLEAYKLSVDVPASLSLRHAMCHYRHIWASPSRRQLNIRMRTHASITNSCTPSTVRKRLALTTMLALSLLSGLGTTHAQTQDEAQEAATAFAAMIFAMLPPADESGQLTRNGVPLFIKVIGLEDETVAVIAQNKITESMVTRNAELFADVLFEHSLGVDMES